MSKRPVRYLALGEAQRSRAKESATCAQRAGRAIKIGILVLCATVCGCTQANLTNGTSTASYRGVKIFSATVVSLRSGNCATPSVDAAGIVTEPPAPPSEKAAGAPDCSTAVMTVNGVDLKGFVNVFTTTILGAMAAG